MDAGRIDLEVTTPERRVVSETVDEIVLPAADGYLGVLPGHAPLLCGLSAGAVVYRADGRERRLCVSAGFAEILRNRVVILADTAERVEEIDLERAKRSLARAEKTIAAGGDSTDDFAAAQARLRRAVARINVKEGIR